MKTNKGFSLVELIVVIAIMAIIAAVAIPVYSTYVDKANKAADEQLVADIKYALSLALQGDAEHEFSGSVAVMLNADGATVQTTSGSADDVTFVENAIKSAYGEDWANTCKLKYSGWTGGSAADIVADYKDSSFSGNEDALIEQVGNLTDKMSEFFASSNHNIPDSLKNFMDKNGIAEDDTTGIANSTVLVFADTFNTVGKSSDEVAIINGAKEDISNALTNMVVDYYGNGNNIGLTTEKINAAYTSIYTNNGDQNMVLLATAATLYAYAEAYAQYGATNHNYTFALDTLHNINYDTSTGAAALGSVVAAFEQIVADADGGNGASIANAYFAPNGQAEKDAKSIFSVLDAINSSSDALSSDLSNPNFYTDGTIADLLNAYIAVGSLNIENGQAAIVVNPNKSVVAYLGGLKE